MSVIQTAPVIAIDGPTASGKGTIAAHVAQALGFGYLDSGAMYRLTALYSQLKGVSQEDEIRLTELAGNLPARFDAGSVWLGDIDVTEAIRQEQVGNLASKIAVIVPLRAALLARQRAFAVNPGLVADGRDMGSVVFPHACLKVFLTASVQERANRRYKQLIEKGISVNFTDLLQDLRARDDRDMNRAVAPLKPCEGAWVLDSTGVGIQEIVDSIVKKYREMG